MKKFSMDEATFDKFKKLIAEGDEMDMALDDSDGKSFRDVVSAISEECGLQINNCGDSEAELGMNGCLVSSGIQTNPFL